MASVEGVIKAAIRKVIVGVELTTNVAKGGVRKPVGSSRVRQVGVRSSVKKLEVTAETHIVTTANGLVKVHVAHVRRIQSDVGLAVWRKVLVVWPRGEGGGEVIEVKPLDAQSRCGLLHRSGAKVERNVV